MSRAITALESLAWNSLDPNQLIYCPYDPAHRFLRKKLQYHLLKEHPNYSRDAYMICPFNASHRVSKQEFDYHLVNCESRASVEADMIYMSDPNPVKGDTSLPVTSWQPPTFDEAWDDGDKGGEFKLDWKMSGRTVTAEVRSHATPAPKPAKEPPVVRMPSKSSAVDTFSPRKVFGRGRGRAYHTSTHAVSKPGLAQPPGPGTLQQTQPAYRVPGQHQPSSTCVGRGSSVSLPNPVLGRGLNALVQSNPASGQLPPQSTQPIVPASLRSPQTTQQVVPASPQVTPGSLQSSEKSDAASLVSTDSEDEERKTIQNKVRKLRKMLRQIEKIEEKEHLAIPLQHEQIAKLQRKGDVLSSLAVAEEELRKLQLS